MKNVIKLTVKRKSVKNGGICTKGQIQFVMIIIAFFRLWGPVGTEKRTSPILGHQEILVLNNNTFSMIN